MPRRGEKAGQAPANLFELRSWPWEWEPDGPEVEDCAREEDEGYEPLRRCAGQQVVSQEQTENQPEGADDWQRWQVEHAFEHEALPHDGARAQDRAQLLEARGGAQANRELLSESDACHAGETFMLRPRPAIDARG